MPAGKARTRIEWLRHTDALYTGEGRPLSTTYYDYDQEGRIARTLQEYSQDGDKTEEADVTLRQTIRDAYGVIVSEAYAGTDGVLFQRPRTIIYEKGEMARVQRVIEAGRDEETKETYGIIRYITYDYNHPVRRGLISRVCHLTPSGALNYEYRYEYDYRGEKTDIYGKRRYNGDLGVLERLSQRDIEYDEQGSIGWYRDNDDEYMIENTYDEKERLQQAMVWKRVDSEEWQLAYRHEYTYEAYEVVVPATPRVCLFPGHRNFKAPPLR